MKGKVFSILSLLLLSAGFNAAALDMLRHYNPSSASIVAPSGYKMYISRFEPLGPGNLEKLVVWLGGSSSNGTAKLHVFGHDGGTAFPQWQEDLVPPITITKTVSGNEAIEVTLPQPVWLDNNQFFIALEDLSLNVRAVSSDEAPFANCTSSSGGDYYYQFCHNPVASSPWVLGNKKSLKIDALMDYKDLVPDNYFTDVTISSGLPDNLSNKNIAWGDYNKDTYLDLIVGGKLFCNNKDGTFTDTTDGVGVSGMGTAMFADINNDGWLDILSLGDSTKNIVFVNNNGMFTANKFSVLFQTFGPVKALSIADIDKDRFPDFFAARLWTTYGVNDSAFLFYNNQSLGFNDSTHLLFSNGINGNCRGSIWVDYDNDGDLDLYIANYVTQQNPPRDRFFRNNGDGTFTDIIGQTPLDNNQSNGNPFYNMSSGVDFGDYDNDGDMDALLPTLSHPHYMKPYDTRPTTIFNNSGTPSYNFTDMRATQGIQYEETHAGSTWGDINNDGLMDIITTAFYGCRYIDIYIQQPDHSFKMETFDYGLKDITTGEDAVWVDYNNDGWLDLACGQSNKFRLFKSNYPYGRKFVEFDLESSTGNIQGIGARVYVHTDGGTFMRELTAGKGELMQHPARAHFGLGWWSIDSVTVRWPDSNNSVTVHKNIDPYKIYLLRQNGMDTVLSVPDKEVISELKVYPNPLSKETYFRFYLADKHNVALDIYNVTGQRVKRICNEHFSRGQHTLKWTRNNDTEAEVPAGVYYYKLQVDDVVKSGVLQVR